MTVAARRPGPDSTLAKVRSQLIQAGISLLRERGVEVGLDDVSLTDAIRVAGVTRSTAYRSLADEDLPPQAVMHRGVLTYILSRYTRGDARSAIETVIDAELSHHRGALVSGGPAERTLAMRSIIRRAANTSYQAVIDAPERSILTATYGALRSSPTRVDWRHDAVREGERGVTTMFADFYRALAERFDYRLKTPFTMDQFSTAGVSLIEGLAMRHGFNDQVTIITRPTGPTNSEEEWSLFAISFEALFIGMFEPSNPDNPFADLSRY